KNGIHGAVVATMCRNHGQLKSRLALQTLKGAVIHLPNRNSLCREFSRTLNLSPEKRRAQVAADVRRADVDPGVLVDLAAEELASVRPLFLNYLGAIEPILAVDEKGADLAAYNVLRLVEAEAGRVGPAPDGFVAVGRAITLGGVFDDDNAACARQFGEGSDLRADPCIIDRGDGPRARCNRV